MHVVARPKLMKLTRTTALPRQSRDFFAQGGTPFCAPEVMNLLLAE
jgi:hypothetical protein